MMRKQDLNTKTFEIDKKDIEAIIDEYHNSKGKIEKRLIEIMNNEANSTYEALYNSYDRESDE